jgi:UDP-N-acetylmuramate dehydrogenase
MQIQQNISLKKYNTFGIDVPARQFASFESVTELKEIVEAPSGSTTFGDSMPVLILGGGSNILFTKAVDALVLKNNIKGIEKIKEDDEFIYIKAGAGEEWHPFVQHCIANNWCGTENLSLIPGNVGASPMQNIGAYGVEIKELFHELEAYHLRDKTLVNFGINDCHFGYRDSVFKNKYKNLFAIMAVTYRLRKQPVFNISYGAIKQELELMNIKELSIQAISQAVIRIRSSKLPDPKLIGNAGSFYKNPTVPAWKYRSLLASFPDLVGYANPDGSMKLAAGWMIEQCGWKGFRRGDAGCHSKQALVLVNYGTATGEEIDALSGEIVESVREKFGVVLEREVNII